MRRKSITIFAVCLATVVSQAPVASAATISGSLGPGYTSFVFKCC